MLGSLWVGDGGSGPLPRTPQSRKWEARIQAEEKKAALRTSPQPIDRLTYAGGYSPAGNLILEDERADEDAEIAVGNRIINLPLLHEGLSPHLCCANGECGAKGAMALSLKDEGERGFAGVLK